MDHSRWFVRDKLLLLERLENGNIRILNKLYFFFNFFFSTLGCFSLLSYLFGTLLQRGKEVERNGIEREKGKNFSVACVFSLKIFSFASFLCDFPGIILQTPNARIEFNIFFPSYLVREASFYTTFLVQNRNLLSYN